MRVRLDLSAPVEDLPDLRREYHQRKLDAAVAGLWRACWVVLAILAAGFLADL